MIRDHCTSEDIKASYHENNSDFDFKKQRSVFNFPNIMCRSENPIKIIGHFLTFNQYIAAHKTEFKRSVAEFLVTKVYNTKRKILLNYSIFKYFEMQGEKSRDRKYLSAVLMAKDLSATIALRREEWINIFFYNFHIIADLTNEILAKEELANDIDKKAALLGLKCHKRGIEPYFPSTAFFSGKAYDYSASKENANVDTDNSNVTNNTKSTGNTKEKKTFKGYKTYQEW